MVIGRPIAYCRRCFECRRDALDPPDRRRCVGYERLANNRYRNTDGVEFCIGPCQ